MTGLSGGVARAVLSTRDAPANDQLYDLVKDPREQNNLAQDPAHQTILKQLKKTLQKELRQFKGRPFGEFIPGTNTAAGGTYNEVLTKLRAEALQGKQKKRKP